MTAPDIANVAVLGAGTMGKGIAQVCAQAGYRVKLFDANHATLEQAISDIEAVLNLAVEKGKITAAQKLQCLSHLMIVKNMSDLQCDFAIEAVVEDLGIKQSLLLQLEQVNESDTILATNTSSIPVTQIASRLQRPQNFVGLHFFNPAPLMKLVEVVAGASTSEVVVEHAKHFAVSVGKVPVVTRDSPGFIVNRVARHFYVEALKLAEERAASFEDIDMLARDSGFKMGPFELMDLIGMDVNFAVTKSLYDGFLGEPRFRPSRLQQQKIDGGHLGRKTGRGFYSYPPK